VYLNSKMMSGVTMSLISRIADTLFHMTDLLDGHS